MQRRGMSVLVNREINMLSTAWGRCAFWVMAFRKISKGRFGC